MILAVLRRTTLQVRGASNSTSNLSCVACLPFWRWLVIWMENSCQLFSAILINWQIKLQSTVQTIFRFIKLIWRVIQITNSVKYFWGWNWGEKLGVPLAFFQFLAQKFLFEKYLFEFSIFYDWNWSRDTKNNDWKRCLLLHDLIERPKNTDVKSYLRRICRASFPFGILLKILNTVSFANQSKHSFDSKKSINDIFTPIWIMYINSRLLYCAVKLIIYTVLSRKDKSTPPATVNTTRVFRLPILDGA